MAKNKKITHSKQDSVSISMDMSNMLSTEEVQKITDYSVSLIYKLKNEGRLTPIKVGNRLMFDRKEVQEVLKSKTIFTRSKRDENLNVPGKGILATEDVSISVTIAPADYNILSLVLNSKNISIEEWIEKIIHETAQQSLSAVTTSVGSF